MNTLSKPLRLRLHKFLRTSLTHSTMESTPKSKVVVVMGATGTGKSKLAIDIAGRYSGEVINCDKIQLHQGLPILTNKVTLSESAGIPHHLIDVLPPNAPFSAADFRLLAASTVSAVLASGRLPIIAGGSNSFLEELVDGDDAAFRNAHDICFLWVDVAAEDLHVAVADRVEKMVEKGIVEEVREVFDPEVNDYSIGIRRAIGVPEMDGYFRLEKMLDNDLRAVLLDICVDLVKASTKKLANTQLEKIQRLRTLPGWRIERIDATEVFRKKGEEAEKAWEKLVLGPAVEILEKFFEPARKAEVNGVDFQ